MPVVAPSDSEAKVQTQTLIVFAVVSLAAAFVARRAWRMMQAAKRPADGCGSDCGCGNSGTAGQNDR